MKALSELWRKTKIAWYKYQLDRIDDELNAVVDETDAYYDMVRNELCKEWAMYWNELCKIR